MAKVRRSLVRQRAQRILRILPVGPGIQHLASPDRPCVRDQAPRGQHPGEHLLCVRHCNGAKGPNVAGYDYLFQSAPLRHLFARPERRLQVERGQFQSAPLRHLFAPTTVLREFFAKHGFNRHRCGTSSHARAAFTACAARTAFQSAPLRHLFALGEVTSNEAHSFNRHRCGTSSHFSRTLMSSWKKTVSIGTAAAPLRTRRNQRSLGKSGFNRHRCGTSSHGNTWDTAYWGSEVSIGTAAAPLRTSQADLRRSVHRFQSAPLRHLFAPESRVCAY